MGRRAKRAFALLIAAIIGTPLAAAMADPIVLQDWWDGHVVTNPTGAPYHFVLRLDSLQVYTGGLDHALYQSSSVLIDGRGAILDLDQSRILVTGNTRLDIQGCVLMKGGNQYEPGALSYKQGAQGNVRNCVFYQNYWGLSMRTASGIDTRIENCIFFENTVMGAMLNRFGIQPVVTCLSYRNGEGVTGGGNWFIGCDCPSDIPTPWDPGLPACLCENPVFVRPAENPSTCNFHLAIGSPCTQSGTPPGTSIGAYQENPFMLPVLQRSWGEIKGIYRFDNRR